MNENSKWEPGYRPSNGTEGDIFRSQWCNNCVRDHNWHLDPDDGGDTCDILYDGWFGEHSYPSPEGPSEWQERGDYGKGHETRCTGFEGPCSCKNARDPWTGEYVNARA